MKIKLADIADGKLSDEQKAALEGYFKAGGTWAKLLNFSEETVEQVYAKGYAFYDKGEYEQATNAFSTLLQLDPYKAKHWIAAGATLQAQKLYSEALATYELAWAIDETHFEVLYYSAQCACAKGDPGKGKEFLNRLVEKADATHPFYILAKETLYALTTHGEGP